MGKAKVNYKIEPIEAIYQLAPKEIKTLKMRLGIDPYTKQHTLKEISEELGYPFSERARQIEARALRKLRHPSRNCKVI